jgi:hypothetical protein
MAQNWTLMASHGTVLFFLAAHPEATIRQVANALSLTERRVSQIVNDLAEADMLWKEKIGRRNSYEINQEARFPEPTMAGLPLGSFVKVLMEDVA